jgi:hypothetical protein
MASGTVKYRSPKLVYLTEPQAEVLAKALEQIARAVERGETIKFPEKGQVRKLMTLTPAEALRNQAGWLRRTLSEQNGGYKLVTAWDYQEER